MKKEVLAVGISAVLVLVVFTCGCIDFGGEEKKKDTTPPTISGVGVSDVTSSGATIRWTTDEKSSSVVEYGTTTGYGSTATGSDGVTSHSVTLSDLSSGTTYHYRVKSADSSGNTAASGDYTFTTTGEAADTTPPVISNVQASSITSSSATITWATDESSTSQVKYCIATTCYSTPEDTSLVTNHNVSLTGLNPSTTYTYNVKSKDASDNLAVSDNYTFTTLSTEPTTVYVGGAGPGNYTTIQAGIDAANDGNTAFVYSGTYYEHITITKKINLVGERKDTTVIDGGNTGTVVGVFGSADYARIANFTIRNGKDSTSVVGCGITVSNSYNTIENCNIHSNEDGIELYSNNTLVKNCDVGSNDKMGISISGSYISIQNCNLSYNGLDGIFIVSGSSYNEITYSTLQNNDRWGIWIADGNNSVIHHNNFIDNVFSPQACDECANSWDNGYPSGGNYWSDYTGVDDNGDGIGDTPYDISGGDNQDRYPLMSPVGSEGNGEEVYAISMGSWNQVTGEYIAYSSVIAVQPAGGIKWDDMTWQLYNVSAGAVETGAVFTHYYDMDADGYVEAGDTVRVSIGKAGTFKVKAIVGGSMIYESPSFIINIPEITTDRVVLAELFTGTWCTYCQGAEGTLDTLADEYPRTQLVILEWHDADDYSPPDNSYIDRENYYNINSWPRTWFDGVELVSGGSTNPDDTTTYNNYKQKIDMRLAVSSNLTINMEGVLGDTIGTINASITALGSVTLSNLKVRFVIYEDHQETVYVSGREYRLRYTVVNGTMEEPISISEGQTVVFNKTFTIDSNWNRSKLGVVVFIQSDTTKEVLQAGIYNFVPTKNSRSITPTSSPTIFISSVENCSAKIIQSQNILQSDWKIWVTVEEN